MAEEIERLKDITGINEYAGSSGNIALMPSVFRVKLHI